MQVIVNHLTRMTHPRICIAGIDPITNNHVRPQLLQGKLTTSMLVNNGGNISLGALLELGKVLPSPTPPEIEDHKFEEKNLKLIKQLPPADFWGLLKKVSKCDLPSIFGADLKAHYSGAVVEEGKGINSLGCLLLSFSPIITINYGKLRLVFKNEKFNLNLSITDTRFYNSDFSHFNLGAVNKAKSFIRRGDQIIISVGLTRVFRPPNENPPFYHWLQVNNIYFENNPLWENTK